MQILYIGLPEFLGGFLYTYLHPQLGADKVSGWSWQLITAIWYEGDELTVESSCQKIMKTFIVVWMFQLLLWTLLCNLMEM